MIIDRILDRYDGDAYDPKEFYDDMMSYEEGTDYKISRAMDSGEEEDIRRELCAYIDDAQYNPKIKDFINSVAWLEPDNGKKYKAEIDILGESKKNEERVPFKLTEFPKEIKQMYDACSKKFYCEDELSSVVEVSGGKNGVSSAHYVLRGNYGSDLKLKVEFEYDGHAFTISISGLDETEGYSWVKLGSGTSDSFKKALNAALAELDTTLMPLAIKIRKAAHKGESIMKKHTCSMQKKKESLAKKAEGASDEIRVSDEDVAIVIHDIERFDDRFDDSMIPKDGAEYTLPEFRQLIGDLAETSNGFASVSRDGSDILVTIDVPQENDEGELTDQYREELVLCGTARIHDNSLDQVADYLNGYLDHR